MARAIAAYRISRVDGEPFRKVCRSCGYGNRVHERVCRGSGCGRILRKPPKKAKPARGSMDRVALELTHAQKMADEWTRKVSAAVNRLRYWSMRERQLAAKLQAGPQPPRPKVVKPKPPRRAIIAGPASRQARVDE
jgi:hypothetical protein